MTKRAAGKFEPSRNEYYPTPAKAIDPLIPHLRQAGVKTFVEPCVGEGHLRDYLVQNGFRCVNSGDINQTQRSDARRWGKENFKGADVVVTNTPWSHDLMEAIMLRQTNYLPGWFLVYSDWVFTKQSASIMRERCTDIVPIGRVKWFPDSASVGFDNCCWVRMTAYKQPDQFVEFWPFP